jgi:PIN domain nuclease of toxin-antitoxin system
MKLLLDTHIFLALIEDGVARLPRRVASLLRDGASEHHLSAASLWEIAIKCRLGKLRLSISLGALPELLDGLGVKTVVIDERHALAPSILIRRRAIRSTGCCSRSARSRVSGCSRSTAPWFRIR